MLVPEVRLTWDSQSRTMVRSSRQQPKTLRRFLRGPIPWAWLQVAARLPGQALAVGIAVWHVGGMSKAPRFKVSNGVLGDLGVSRQAGYRGLSELETAGLISVERHRGRSPVVTLLQVDR
jgi:hypothetical protein